MRPLYLLFLLSVCFITAGAQPVLSVNSSPADTVAETYNRAKLDSLLTALDVNNRAMISLAIMHNGKPVYSRAIGYSNLNTDQKIKATPQTRYRIASITKMFTAVMIFQLIEEGKLHLTTPLAQFFPDLPGNGKITIAHMLNHSSGLHDFTNDSSCTPMMSKPITDAELLEKFKTKPDFDPGAKHQYSNTNFVLLGFIVEELDKKTYPAVLAARIFSKVNLPDTYCGNRINSSNKEADSYTWKGSWQPETETDMSVLRGAGALVSTPTDLTKFINALFTGKLISEESLAHMKTMQDGYGMAMFSYPFYNQKGFGHNGGIDGFQSQVVYYPEDKVAVSYTANGVNMSLDDMMIEVLSIIFDQACNINPSVSELHL